MTTPLAEADGFEIRLVLPPRRFRAHAGETLLAAALRAGVPLTSSCRNGTCRACLCRLDSGRVDYLVEWPGLSADEKREGLILPCVARPLTDLLLSPA